MNDTQKALALSAPGAILSPPDAKMVLSTADSIEERGAKTEDERELLRRAAKLRFYTPRPDPMLEDEADWKRRYLEACALKEGRILEANAATDRLAATQLAARAAQMSPDAKNYSERILQQRILGAQQDLLVANASVDRAQAAISDLLDEREARRRAFTAQRVYA